MLVIKVNLNSCHRPIVAPNDTALLTEASLRQCTHQCTLQCTFLEGEPPPLQTIIGDSYKTPLMYLRKDSSPVKKIYQYIISILLEVLSLPKYPPIIVIYWIHVGRRLNGVFLSEPLEITYWHK